MFFTAVHQLKVRVIELLQETLANRPQFSHVTISDHYPRNIERDKIAVIVSGSSMDKVQLSPDNFIQIDIGRVVQAKVDDHPGYFLAWAKDDLTNCENLVDPGVYFFTLSNVRDVPDTGIKQADLLIDYLRTVTKETVLGSYTGETEVYLDHFPVYPNSLALYVNGVLYPPMFYTVDLATGKITFLQEPPPRAPVRADYAVHESSLPPITIKQGEGYTDILPGTVIAFSEEFIEGDRAVVMVSEKREPAAAVYGGRWTVTLSYEARGQDTPQAEKVADMIAETLWSELKPRLHDEGLDLEGVAMGGETVASEEEVGGEQSFSFSFSTPFQTNWEVRVPIPRKFRVGLVNIPKEVDFFTVSDEELVAITLQVVLSPDMGPVLTLPLPPVPKCG